GMAVSDSSAGSRPLAGQTLFLSGRVQGVTRRRLDQLVRLRRGQLAAKPTGRITIIALGHSAVSNALPDGRVRLPAGLPAAAPPMRAPALGRPPGRLRPPA